MVRNTVLLHIQTGRKISLRRIPSKNTLKRFVTSNDVGCVFWLLAISVEYHFRVLSNFTNDVCTAGFPFLQNERKYLHFVLTTSGIRFNIVIH